MISGKGADGKDAMFVETTDKTTGAKTYNVATVDKDGKVAEGAAVTMKNPLDTLDKALSQVDSCVLPWVRYRTVSILLSRT